MHVNMGWVIPCQIDEDIHSHLGRIIIKSLLGVRQEFAEGNRELAESSPRARR
ncbi:hypothetical protein B296_00024315, partial [Ensete ventricosum]